MMQEAITICYYTACLTANGSVLMAIGFFVRRRKAEDVSLNKLARLNIGFFIFVPSFACIRQIGINKAFAHSI